MLDADVALDDRRYEAHVRERRRRQLAALKRTVLPGGCVLIELPPLAEVIDADGQTRTIRRWPRPNRGAP